ncbi:glucosaminidase domain-containing protein [Candidatus Sulfidibacterium hydrothermale]|uniref:glucosaminidase domain-containing protein n=1 Tax=Candidatus Sulfidibacterium hydrothermale TaxID=2875962 RepID=UPI001F0AB0A0|nr:glucosaminidase domain-containing protein [Candidatus Sulfidibacterium hydrothermale]UBM62028.1 glucosaminidase domain-containing protein [Candidatus Sulfidibacterium hydrothermale]
MKHSIRYLLVLLLFILSKGGAFPEESGKPVHHVSLTSPQTTTLLIPVKQNHFVVFSPAEYVFFREKRKKTSPLPKNIRIPVSIMGHGKLKASALAAFLHQNNPDIPLWEAKKIARIYIEEARAEGVNYDVAFSQMCLETGFLRYGGTVLPGQNNFCGLGVLNQKTRGVTFQDLRLGIRAHIQHLKAYASNKKLNQKLVDPRFRFVARGSIQNINQLSGHWASDKHYGKKIRYLLTRLYRESV